MYYLCRQSTLSIFSIKGVHSALHMVDTNIAAGIGMTLSIQICIIPILCKYLICKYKCQGGGGGGIQLEYFMRYNHFHEIQYTFTA